MWISSTTANIKTYVKINLCTNAMQSRKILILLSCDVVRSLYLQYHDEDVLVEALQPTDLWEIKRWLIRGQDEITRLQSREWKSLFLANDKLLLHSYV
jgi:hypothetical protein